MSVALKKKAVRVDEILEAEYGLPELGGRTVMEELIVTLLSHNTNDVNRDRAYAELKRRYPTWEELAQAAREDIEDAINIAGLATAKSGYIVETLKFVRDNWGSYDLQWICRKDPDWIEATFTKVKGIGVKTINVVMAFACGMDRFPVDTHVNRLSMRLGFVPEGSPPEKTYRIMTNLAPAGKKGSMHLNIIRHGRKVCTARSPRCGECVLKRLCVYYKANPEIHTKRSA